MPCHHSYYELHCPDEDVVTLEQIARAFIENPIFLSRLAEGEGYEMQLNKEKVVIGRDGLNRFLDMWTRMTSKKTVNAAVVV